MAFISDETKEQLRRFMELRDRKEEAEAAEKAAVAAYRDAEADLYDAFQQSGVKGKVRVDLGPPWGEVMFGASKTDYATVLDAEAAREYYAARSSTGAVSEPKFVMKVLNAEVRTAKEQGLPLPPGLGWIERRVISVTRQK